MTAHNNQLCEPLRPGLQCPELVYTARLLMRAEQPAHTAEPTATVITNKTATAGFQLLGPDGRDGQICAYSISRPGSLEAQPVTLGETQRRSATAFARRGVNGFVLTDEYYAAKLHVDRNNIGKSFSSSPAALRDGVATKDWRSIF